MNTTFRDIVFEGDVSFDRCVFVGKTCFENVEFAGRVSFANARADAQKPDARHYFIPSTDGQVTFRHVSFHGPINLSQAELFHLIIVRSQFAADAELYLCGEIAELKHVHFAGRVRFSGRPQHLDLYRVVFPDGVKFSLDRTDVTLSEVEFGAPSSLNAQCVASRGRPRLSGVSGTDLSALSVFSTDLSCCSFGGAHNVSEFTIDSLDSFGWAPSGPYTRRRVLCDERHYRVLTGKGRRARRWRESTGHNGTGRSASHVAADYRALRKALEDAKDEPGAADFYYGEMEMRRLARRAEMRSALRLRRWRKWFTAATEHAVLWLYWVVSGYGLRAWRALAALIVVLFGASVIFRYAGFPGDSHTYAASLRFAIQSAMSLVRGTDEPLTPTGEWVALTLRLLGPLLFGLALLALRGRVRR